MQKVGARLGVPIGTRRVPNGTHSPQGHFGLFCVFGYVFGLFRPHSSFQKVIVHKISQKFTLIAKLGHLAMPCPFFKKSSSSSFV